MKILSRVINFKILFINSFGLLYGGHFKRVILHVFAYRESKLINGRKKKERKNIRERERERERKKERKNERRREREKQCYMQMCTAWVNKIRQNVFYVISDINTLFAKKL